MNLGFLGFLVSFLELDLILNYAVCNLETVASLDWIFNVLNAFVDLERRFQIKMKRNYIGICFVDKSSERCLQKDVSSNT